MAASVTGLSPAARKRLAQRLGMLGSSFEHERATAAALADDFVRKRLGLTWEDVIVAPQLGRPGATVGADDERPGLPEHQFTALWCLRHGAAVLMARFQRISPRQAAVLARIRRRVELWDIGE